MASTVRTIAIVPARSGSKRIPGKNGRPFAGSPLLSWSIRFARAQACFDRVIVSTDGDELAALAAAEGLPVPFMRPPEISGDTATSVAVAAHALAFEADQGRHYDLVALLQPTSPVRLAQRWLEAFELIANPDVDSVVGVAPVRNHPYHTFKIANEGHLAPFVAGGENLRKMRSQDLPSAYGLVGNLYLTRTAVLASQGTFFPPRTAGVVCSEPYEALDIDTEADWVLAETITKHFGQEPWPPSS